MVEVTGAYKTYALKDSGIVIHYNDDNGEAHQFYLSHSVLAEMGYGSTNKFGRSPSNDYDTDTHKKVVVDWTPEGRSSPPGVIFDD